MCSAPSLPLGGNRKLPHFAARQFPLCVGLLVAMGIAESETKLLPFFTLLYVNQICHLTAASPLGCTMMGELQGLGLKGFKLAGRISEPQGSPHCSPATTASLWPCPCHHGTAVEGAGDHSSFCIDLMVFCPGVSSAWTQVAKEGLLAPG